MTSGPINLIACVGVKSSPYLISHFLEHYHTLGVQRFHIILHSEIGDPRADELKRRLAEWNIQPIREIQEYSSPGKVGLFSELIAANCAPDSWVIHADIDELQVYPGGLIPYLENCERRGRKFARGRFVDRLAPEGVLAEMQPHPTLWEQFPVSSRVSHRLTGAWDRKVCAARASVRVADGGSHSISYGLGWLWNYRLTHHLPRWHEQLVEIHHFKWDATLPQRVHEKLEGLGGDRDSAVKAGFLHEYRRLDEHLKSFGRINLAAI